MTRLVRYHRLGSWVSRKSPRPVLIEFENQSDRDRFLGMAQVIAQSTGGRLKIVPDHGKKDVISTGAKQLQSARVVLTPCTELAGGPFCSSGDVSNCKGTLDFLGSETVVRR